MVTYQANSHIDEAMLVALEFPATFEHLHSSCYVLLDHSTWGGGGGGGGGGGHSNVATSDFITNMTKSHTHIYTHAHNTPTDTRAHLHTHTQTYS